MKKLLILLSILNSCLSVLGYEADAVYKNFANVILGEEGKYIVSTQYIHPQKRAELGLYDYPNYSKFQKNSYKIINRIVSSSFCEKKFPDIIFLYQKELAPTISDPPRWNNRSWHYGTMDSNWLLIVTSMYDKSGVFKGGKGLLGIEDFSFINKDSFYSVVLPEIYNTICLKWEEGSSKYKLIEEIKLSTEDLVADVQLLSKLFSNNDNLLRDEKLELVAKAMPNLKTEEGKKIAEAMISIIEKEPVLLESILARKIKITVDVNYESVY